MSDILFRRGWIIDGTGKPGFRGDVAVADGVVASVADGIHPQAGRVVDVDGCIVSPGFVDLHSHGDYGILRFGDAENLLRQGCTTAVVGNCGLSLAPLPTTSAASIVSQFPFVPREERDASRFDWTTFGEYLAEVAAAGLGINIAALVGHGTLRRIVMHGGARPALDAEVEEMSRILDACFDDGSIGMSTGLIYPPGADAKTSELVALCRTIARREKLYATHIRSEANRLLEAVDEALFLAKETGVRLHISHLKAAGMSNWGKVTEALAAIEQARRLGCDVTCDAYPYSAGSTTLAALLPPWAAGGGIHSLRARLVEQEVRARIAEDLQREQTTWDNLYGCVGPKNISIAICPVQPELEGQSLDDLSHRFLKSPIETLLDLLMEDPEGVLVVLHEMAEDDVKKVVSHPLCAICSDGDIRTPSRAERLHPRTYGAFTRAIIGARDGEYPVTMEEMIRKMTSLPASRIRMRSRGAIQQGMSADLAVFSLEELHERCSYDSPNQCATGMRFVVVNGQMVLDDGELSSARPGTVVR